MIDVENAKEVFEEYVNKFDRLNPKINIKIEHTYRVTNNCEKIARFLKLNEEDVKLAQLIGILHDLGRFIQIQKYDTFLDRISIDHAKLAIQLLFENNNGELIRKFIKTSEYDEIIKEAILDHNRKDIKQYDKNNKIFSRIIRDADKIDLFPVVIDEGIENAVVFKIKDIAQEKITQEIYEDCVNCRNCRKQFMNTNVDCIAVWIGYIYDLSFDISLKIIQENDYINRLINLIDYKDKDTRQKMEEIKTNANNYVKKALNMI